MDTRYPPIDVASGEDGADGADGQIAPKFLTKNTGTLCSTLFSVTRAIPFFPEGGYIIEWVSRVLSTGGSVNQIHGSSNTIRVLRTEIRVRFVCKS